MGSVNVIGKKKDVNDMFLRVVFAENGLFDHKAEEWAPRAVDVAVVVNMDNLQLNGMIGVLL